MIKSEEELLKIVVEIRGEIPESSILLFRGQQEKFDKIRSGMARPNAFSNPEVESGWHTIVNRISIGSSNTNYNKAILQHYGYPTYFMDLTEDPLTAGFFATQNFKFLEPSLWIGDTFRTHDEATYTRNDLGIGYIYVLEIPDYEKMISDNELFDISGETNFKRPNAQSAYLMLDQPPRLPDPNQFIKQIIEVDRTIFASSKTVGELFPHPKQDKGYAELLDVPFVQLPSFYLDKNNPEDEEKQEGKQKNNPKTDPFDQNNLKGFDRHLCFGKRAIKIPFYVESKSDLFDYNPKWKDFTIWEPSEFRLWKTIPFNLREVHEGQVSIFGHTTKIIMTPDAYNTLRDSEDSVTLRWPNVNSNSIFFSRAVYHHDKVPEHSAPYLGVWLHKNDNLILEMHLISDENDKLLFTLGHAYELKDNQIKYVKSKAECDCGKPEQHYELIESLLKIPNVIQNEKVALIEHPDKLPLCFVLL